MLETLIQVLVVGSDNGAYINRMDRLSKRRLTVLSEPAESIGPWVGSKVTQAGEAARCQCGRWVVVCKAQADRVCEVQSIAAINNLDRPASTLEPHSHT